MNQKIYSSLRLKTPETKIQKILETKVSATKISVPKERHVFHYWLTKLSSYLIQNFKVKHAVFNPQIIELFFGAHKIFNIHNFHFSNDGICIPKVFVFMYGHVVIHGGFLHNEF
ncbi:unnamed protein product [Meloidogyne enterolobii]|uniref:Uncharacterized protein n=1 Tax=Meloidogyne enterolobii TaxID=390850 RepID=A0ACB0XV08_MELEN